MEAAEHRFGRHQVLEGVEHAHRRERPVAEDPRQNLGDPVGLREVHHLRLEAPSGEGFDRLGVAVESDVGEAELGEGLGDGPVPAAEVDDDPAGPQPVPPDQLDRPR